MDWELFTYIIWMINILITIVVFITLIRKRKIKKELQKGTHSIKEIDETERVEKKINPLNEDEKRVISKLAVYGGYSGVSQEELQDLAGMDSNIYQILNNLETKGIVKQRASDSERIGLCKWAQDVLKDMSRDRELNITEVHTLNVVCVLKEGDNITQKELSKRAEVPTSTLSNIIIPLLEDLYMAERVSVGSGKLVRLIMK